MFVFLFFIKLKCTLKEINDISLEEELENYTSLYSANLNKNKLHSYLLTENVTGESSKNVIGCDITSSNYQIFEQDISLLSNKKEIVNSEEDSYEFNFYSNSKKESFSLLNSICADEIRSKNDTYLSLDQEEKDLKQKIDIVFFKEDLNHSDKMLPKPKVLPSERIIDQLIGCNKPHLKIQNDLNQLYMTEQIFQSDFELTKDFSKSLEDFQDTNNIFSSDLKNDSDEKNLSFFLPGILDEDDANGSRKHVNSSSSEEILSYKRNTSDLESIDVPSCSKGSISSRKEKRSHVFGIVHKYLKKLQVFLDLKNIVINDPINKKVTYYYMTKTSNPLHESSVFIQSHRLLVEEKIVDIFSVVSTFVIPHSYNFEFEGSIYIGKKLHKLFSNYESENFGYYLKRNYSLIRNCNIYLYLSSQMQSTLESLPTEILIHSLNLMEIMKEVDSINIKNTEFTELNTIYSLLKFKTYENRSILIVYFFVRIMNMLLNTDIEDKMDRIYICYNFIFLILDDHSSKIRNLIPDISMTNTYVNMCIIVNDLIWKDKRYKLDEIILKESFNIYGSLISSKSLLIHIFLTLEIIFVNKILDDYEENDVVVRFKSRSILKRKIKKYFSKSKGINKLKLVKASLALHNYIVKKDFSLLDDLI